MELSLGVLGPVRVLTPSGPLHLRPAQRRLLSILLLEPGGELSRETLLDRMWGESPPATANTSLHVHVSGLRRAVPGLISTTANGYRVEISGRTLDKTRFDEQAERAVAAAAAGEWQAAFGAASRALECWRGTPFDELEDTDYAAPEINRLTERRLSLLEVQTRALLELQRLDEAVQLLKEVVQRHPLREPLWELLMQALYRSGRRAEALRTFQEVRRVLAEELDVEPGHALRELEERMLVGDPLLGEVDAAAAPHSLPAAGTSFVGREEELRYLAGLLSSERLITIVGGPGFGKTRLAIETGQAVAERSALDVWFVSLAEARNPLEVMGAIVSATGLHDYARSPVDIVKRLAHRPGVLILDNCEHQVGTCAEFIRQALSAGTELRFLVTSRRALGVEGEQLWRIDPLAAPAQHDVAAGVSAPASASPAVQLFVDRARAVDRTFRLTPETAPAVAELCRRAGGIPLALELAARWVPALGLGDIAEMLADEPPGTAASAVDHHRSVTAAIEWSMALLPPEDRQLFIRTAVFNGRFGLDDIRAVCVPGHEPRRLARAVAGLADTSLIVVERQLDGAALYRMLAPIRDFARGQLAASTEWDATRLRFVDHYLGKPYRDHQDPLQQVVDLETVDRDLDNLREAFELGVELGRADEVARMLVRLDGYMLNRYLVAERRFWLERALDEISDPLTHAHALRSLGSGAQVLNDLDESLAFFRQALPIFRESDDTHGLAQCLLSLSGLLSMRGEWSEGLAAAREAGQLSSGLGSTSGLGVAAYYVGENLVYGGDVSGGLSELREAARLFERAGELGRAAYALSTLTSVAVLADKEDLARRIAPRALARADDSKSTYRRVRALGSAALFEARYGDPEAARTMLLEVHGLMEPYEMDDVFLFLLPSAYLLRHWGRWALLGDVLEGAEAAMADKGVGYPRPWRDAVELLKREAVRELGPPGAGALPPRASRTLEQVTADVLLELGRPRTQSARCGST